jgi:hypothetical protein
MAMTTTAAAMIDRLHQAAMKWEAERESAVMPSGWDPAMGTDQALRDCVFAHCVAAISFVKRRRRSDALEAVTAATFEGYRRARYLLGTHGARPNYSHDPGQVRGNSDLISHKMTAFSYDKVIWALMGGDNGLISDIGMTRARFPLRGVIRPDRADGLFLTSYCLGMAAALAEEQLFGPLA